MDLQIALILAVDGIANGAVYALIALGFVLIFAVTRVVFVPFGDIAAFTALSLASIEAGRLPGTVGLVTVLAALATLREVVDHIRAGEAALVPRALLVYLALPALPAFAVWLLSGVPLGMPARILLALLLTLPIAPLIDRIVFRPIADGSVFSGLHFLVFNATLAGKALRATAINRVGARLMGIRPARAGTLAYLLASVLAGISGVLIAPVNTIFYDSGFLLGLKAFVGAIIGAMASYPATALGAVLVALLESFASFYSSALKEVVVFGLLIPVLLWRSLSLGHEEEEEAEE